MAAGEAGGRYIDTAGDILTGPLNLGGNPATRLAPGTEPGEAASMQQLADIAEPRYAHISGSGGTPTQGELWVNTSRKTFEWDTEWRNLPLQNGWTAYTGPGIHPPPQCRKFPDGRVMLRGALHNNNAPRDADIAPLPIGYRTLEQHIFLCYTWVPATADAHYSRVDIIPTGMVRFVQHRTGLTNITITLDGIIYYPEK